MSRPDANNPFPGEVWKTKAGRLALIMKDYRTDSPYLCMLVHMEDGETSIHDYHGRLDHRVAVDQTVIQYVEMLNKLT